MLIEPKGREYVDGSGSSRGGSTDTSAYDNISMERAFTSLSKVATAPPLCLNPDPHLTRMANHVLRVSVPKTPPSLKRKAAVMEHEEEERDKARRLKMSQFMNPRNNRATPPKYAFTPQSSWQRLTAF